MATAMNPEPEYTRHERFIQYTEALRERFDSGVLAELQDLTQWVVWRGEIEDGKHKKVPYNPHYYHLHAKASVKIPNSWGSLDQALEALDSGKYSGIGIVITPPLVFIDLDKRVQKETGTITDPQAAEIVQSLNSYTELSPSGTGLQILSSADTPIKSLHTAIEIYQQDRFTTITTDHIAGTPLTIENRTEEVLALYNRFAPPVRETTNQNTRGGVWSGSTLTELPPEAEYDAVLQRLLSGDIAGYKSQSSADFVLIMKLLHWTGDNVELTRRIFLSSPLGQREKAQRKTGETTYVDMTINNVLKNLQMPVKGGRPKKEMPFKAERRHQYWTTDIRYLDMHQLSGGMIYCISILENFSRAILASAISRRQDTEAYLAVLYAAIRKYGVPEMLVSDSGGVFRSHDAMSIYEALGIQKVEIDKRQAWQSYIESNFNAQRRLADWHFERAQTWEDLLAAHEKWLLDFNYQHHFAHEQREDGCHSPAAVLSWVKGMQPEPELIYRAFSAVGETRTITKAGYVRFRDYLLYGERILAGERALVNLFQDVLTLEYQEQPLSRYSVEWQPDEKHLRRAGNPRLYNHPYQSAQLPLWPEGAGEWYLILRAAPYGPRPRRKKSCLVFLQVPPIFASEGEQR